MYTSATKSYTSVTNNIKKQKKRLLKTAIIYLAVSVFCIIFDKVYAIFGHGVYSDSMSLMFLYPLAGGTLVFTLLWLFATNVLDYKHYRLSFNSYNSGIATLTIGSTLNGICEIAGTSSSYLIVFTICGIVFCLFGFIGLIIGATSDNNKERNLFC